MSLTPENNINHDIERLQDDQPPPAKRIRRESDEDVSMAQSPPPVPTLNHDVEMAHPASIDFIVNGNNLNGDLNNHVDIHSPNGVNGSIISPEPTPIPTHVSPPPPPPAPTPAVELSLPEPQQPPLPEPVVVEQPLPKEPSPMEQDPPAPMGIPHQEQLPEPQPVLPPPVETPVTPIVEQQVPAADDSFPVAPTEEFKTEPEQEPTSAIAEDLVLPDFTTPAAPLTTDIALTPTQYRFLQSTIRTLKKMKDAIPFLRPVDPVAFQIPLYPTIIKNPMDFGTVERKLSSSNPQKPDENPNNPRYNTADEFIADVRLIFANCLTFNGPDHAVTAMAKRVEETFDRQIKNMPSAEFKPPPVKKEPVAGIPAPKKAAPQRKSSGSGSAVRRTDSTVVRPKREVHAPPRELPYADSASAKKVTRPKTSKSGAGRGRDTNAAQLRFCSQVLDQLNRKSHWNIANPFYDPVDWKALDLPTYPVVVKQPMDLSTMRKKLDGGHYSNAQKFYDDFKLMIRNCFAFNPPGTPVNQAGKELQRLFDEKWKGLPIDQDIGTEDEDLDEYDDDQEDEEDERLIAIRVMEKQLATMRADHAAFQQNKHQAVVARKPPKPVKEKSRKHNPNNDVYAPSSSASASKASKSGGLKKGNKKKAITDDDVLSFEQKKELSEAIATLDGPKLERVIQIIHDGVPEIRDSTEEIELEIDLLPASVLTKLYNFVIRPIKTAGMPKRSRIPKGTGTGGLKRKSMDEDVEAEKIRVLEERMRAFDRAEQGGQAGNDSQSSDSSDNDSDSSDDSD